MYHFYLDHVHSTGNCYWIISSPRILATWNPIEKQHVIRFLMTRRRWRLHDDDVPARPCAPYTTSPTFSSSSRSPIATLLRAGYLAVSLNDERHESREIILKDTACDAKRQWRQRRRRRQRRQRRRQRADDCDILFFSLFFPPRFFFHLFCLSEWRPRTDRKKLDRDLLPRK